MKPSNRKIVIPFAVLMTCSLLNPSSMWADSTQAVSSSSSGTSARLITQDEAVHAIKKVISIPDDYALQSIHSNSGGVGWNQGPTWNLGWQTSPAGPGAKMGGLNVTVDATSGTILSLNRWTNSPSSTNTSQVDQQEAQKIATEFINKLQPNEAALVKFVDQSQPFYGGGLKQPVQYQIHYVRMVHGIPAPFDGFQVGVSEHGEVVSYQYHWSQVTFPEIGQVIPLEKANQIYTDSLGMHVEYQSMVNKDNRQQPIQRLVYKPSYTPFLKPMLGGFGGTLMPPVLDANTGKIMDQSGKVLTNQDSKIKPLDAGAAVSPPEKREKPLTQEEAQQIAQSFTVIDPSYRLLNTSYNQMGIGNPVWSFNWNQQEGGGISIGVDAVTGQVRSFNTYGPKQANEKDPFISEEQATQKAIEFVKKTVPNQLGDVYVIGVQPRPVPLDAQMKTMPRVPYFVQFGKLINGIPAPTSGLNVQVDPSSGKIIGFNNNLDNPGPYPDAGHVIPVDQAKSLWMQHMPLSLQYMLPLTSDHTSLQTQAIPVYAVQQKMETSELLDAFSGEWFRPYPGPLSSDHEKAEDVGGHWAEKQLQRLIDRGILDVVKGKVHPDQTVSLGEFLKYIVRSFAPPIYGGNSKPNEKTNLTNIQKDNPYYSFVETAIRYGWIEKSNDIPIDQTLSRVQMADILTRVIGEGNLAKHSEVFHLPYQDAELIPSSSQGAVAISYALGVLRGDGSGNFDPNGQVTIAQMAAALVNTMNFLTENTSNGFSKTIYY